MRLIATSQEEDAFLLDIAEYIKTKGIYTSITRNEDGFGATTWSIDDLDNNTIARNWPHEKRLHFMKMYGEKIGGATDDAWAKMDAYVDEYTKNHKGLMLLH